MKKIGKFLKTTAISVLTFLMAFSVTLSMKDTGNALRVKAVSNSKVYTTDYYTLSYSDNEVKLLVNPDVRVYQNFTKEDLVTLKNNVISVAYEAILDDAALTGSQSKSSKARRNAPSTSILAGKDVDISNITDIINGQLTDLDSIDDALAEDGTYDVLVKYYVDRYVEAYVAANPTADEYDVLDEISTQLTASVQSAVDAVYAAEGITDVPNVSEKLDTLIQDVSDCIADASQITITLSDVTDIIKTIDDSQTITNVIKEIEVVDEIKDIVINSGTQETVDFFANVDTDLVIDVFKTVDIDKEDFKSMINSIGADGVIDIIDAIGVDKAKDIASSVQLGKDDLKEVIKDNVSSLSIMSLLKTIKSISVDGNTIYADTQIKMDGLESIVRGLPRPAEIANMSDDEMHLTWNVAANTSFGTIEFDLTVGFMNGDCSLIRAAAREAAELVDVSIDNGVVNVTLNVPAKLDDIALRVANSGSVSDNIKHTVFNAFSATVDDVYTKFTNKTYDEYLEILKDVDYKLIAANLYNAENLNKLFGTNKFTAARLDKLVDEVMHLVSKAAQLSQRFDYDEVKSFVSRYVDISKYDDSKVRALVEKAIDVLQRIDAKSLDAALLREFIDPNSQYTSDNIDRYIDKLANYEKYFNKALSYVERAYNAAPDRIKDNTVMDYYAGNGTFKYAGEFNFSIEKILTSVSSRFGDKAYDVLSAVVDKLPSHISVSLTANLVDIYKVTYNYGNVSKVGMLPVGADVEFFANVTEVNGRKVVAWVDADGVAYTTMPKKDVELTAVLEAVNDFDVAISEAVSKVYDGAAATLTVTASAEQTYDYAYQWFKDGSALDGATNPTLDVVNVADSGEYYCVVRVDSIDLEKTTDTVEVSITPKAVTVEDLANASWVDDNGAAVVAYTYDGSTHTLEVTGLPSTVAVSNYDGNVASAAGTYQAVASLALVDAANYTLADDAAALTLTWTIEKATVTAADLASASWVDDNGAAVVAYTYDGSTHTLEVVGLPSTVAVSNYDGNTASAAGTYQAVASLALVDATNYEFAADVNTSLVLAWTIEKATVTAADLANVAWGTNSFTYDGQAHTIVLSGLPSTVTANYVNNEKTNAGSYQAEADLVLVDAANYAFASDANTHLTQSWTIEKVVIGYKWVDNNGEDVENNQTFVYDGQAHTLTVVLLNGVSENLVTITLQNNTATKAGKYLAKATVVPTDSTNYAISEDCLAEINWEITKAVVTAADLANVKWVSENGAEYTAAFTYDGQAHTITLSGLPSTVKATYTENSKVEVGTYTAVANLEVIDTENCAFASGVETSLTKAWEIKGADEPIVVPTKTSFEFKDASGKVLVSVTAKNGVNGDYSLDVTSSNKEVDIASVLKENEEGKTKIVYNISFKDASGTVQTVEDEFTVKVLIPEEIRGSERLVVVYIAADGALTDMEGQVEGEYMVFTTTHFSEYGIAPVNEKVEKQPSLWWLWLLIALLVVAVVVIVVLLLTRKKAVVVVEETPTEEVRYLQVENDVDSVNEVELAEYEVNDILSTVDKNDKFAIGKVVRSADKVSISVFKDYHPVKSSTGKVGEDGQVSVYKEPKDVVLEPETDSEE